MFPVIYKIGPFAIYSYGLMLAVAVLVCSFLLGREARQHQIKSEKIYDFIFTVVIAGIIGGRLFYILLNLAFFIQNPLEIPMIQHGGLAWQGALVLGVIAGWWFIRKAQLPLGLMLDLSAPYLALGQSIGRIGCFLNGCCYGREAAWGIYFPVHGARLQPTQLYDTVLLFIIYFALRHFRRSATVPGQIMVLYFMLASLERFIVEFFRADHTIVVGGLSIFQLVSIGIFLTGLILNLALVKNYKKQTV